MPQPSAASRDGAAMAVAERRKRAAYPELLRPGPGGRWSAESLRLVTQLVRLRAQRAPAALRGVAKQSWLRRWWGLLSMALQGALAATLLGAAYVHGAMPGAQLPALEEVLHDADSDNNPGRRSPPSVAGMAATVQAGGCEGLAFGRLLSEASRQRTQLSRAPLRTAASPRAGYCHAVR